MAVSCFYSHKTLHKKNGNEKLKMLADKGINWKDYPDFFRKGTYIIKKKTERPFENTEDLPEKHEARLNPSLKILRTEYVYGERNQIENESVQ